VEALTGVRADVSADWETTAVKDVGSTAGAGIDVFEIGGESTGVRVSFASSFSITTCVLAALPVVDALIVWRSGVLGAAITGDPVTDAGSVACATGVTVGAGKGASCEEAITGPDTDALLSVAWPETVVVCVVASLTVAAGSASEDNWLVVFDTELSGFNAAFAIVIAACGLTELVWEEFGDCTVVREVTGFLTAV